MHDIVLYHGSRSVIDKPDFNFINPKNDYGCGFYCTKDLNLAKEWAVQEDEDGYANIYLLDMDGLKVLDLSESKYSVLHWITLLVTNRNEEGNGKKKLIRVHDKKMNLKIEWLKANFSLPIENYDIIMGYRADDDYFSITEEFLRKKLPVQALMQALKLGDWGEQIVLKSEKAFSRIKYIGCSKASYKEFYPKRLSRDKDAIMKFKKEISKTHQVDDVTLDQLVAGAVSKDDPRLYYKDDSKLLEKNSDKQLKEE